MSHSLAPTSFVSKYIFSTDHKVIGMQYLITGILMAVLAGFLSYVFRMQIAFPGNSVPLFGSLSAEQYNQVATMHGTIMLFWVAMPVLLAAFGNFVIPLMIGADDMAFPKLNMLSYWVFLISTVILLISFFVPGGAFGGGWTAYPPLSAEVYNPNRGLLVGLGGHLWILAVALEFVAFLMGGINFLVTAANMRAPGLSWFRLPVIVWMMIVAVLIFMFSVGPLVAGAVMLLFDRALGTNFYNPAAGGDPLLYQHLFWFFGHPEVYVILLPDIGIIAEIITTFSRKPIFGYRAIVYSTLAAGFITFFVWAHHQFVAGIDPRMANFFSATTIIISVPFAVIVFCMLATLWKGRIRFELPMLWAIGFLATFLVGGVTGIYLGSSAFDIYAHDTYFVIAHFHYVLVPVVLFAGAAATYYWFPKITGRFMNETLGKIHFWLTLIFINVVFMPQFFDGLKGTHRRIYDYSLWKSLSTPDLQNLRVISTYGAIVLILAQMLFVYNFFASFFKGKKAGDNPWQANTLEWATTSPPPHGNFAKVPTVYRGPYEYSAPGRSEDYWPQNVPS